MSAGIPGEIAPEWAALLPADGVPAELFEPQMTRELPEPARRWLAHAIDPGTPMWRAAIITMRGEIRLGRWRRFTARQIIHPGEGFIWAGTTRFFGIPVSGFDRYSTGIGQLRWRVLGTVAIVDSTGPDVTRSTAGRLAAESIFVPTTFPRADWQPSGADRVAATWHLDSLSGGYDDTVELRVDARGALRELTMQRWGNPDGQPFGCYPFGAGFDSPRRFGGVTIPTRVHAGWWWGTTAQQNGEFFHAELLAVTFH